MFLQFSQILGFPVSLHLNDLTDLGYIYIYIYIKLKSNSPKILSVQLENALEFTMHEVLLTCENVKKMQMKKEIQFIFDENKSMQVKRSFELRRNKGTKISLKMRRKIARLTIE